MCPVCVGRLSSLLILGQDVVILQNSLYSPVIKLPN